MEKREEKNKLPLIIGGVAAAVVVIIVILFVIPGKNHTDTDLAKVVELSSFTNGFADWEADGFEESVKNWIKIRHSVILRINWKQHA